MNAHTPQVTPIQARLYEGLELWRTVTGVDPETTSLFSSKRDLRMTFDRLQEAIDLDPSGITAALLLTSYAKSFISSQSVSFTTLLSDPEGVARRLEPCRKLMSVLDDEVIASAQAAYEKSLIQALEHYGAHEREDVLALITDAPQMANLRRDALRSMETLRVDQFLSGAPEQSSVKPVYAKTVYKWWNVNSLLAASTSMPAGVALNLIRHPHAYQSYFAFTIRNGGNLFTLSDVPEEAHPLQGYMSRRPDRNLDERISKHWFPYDLLGVAYDDEGDLFIRRTTERSLVAYQSDYLPLKPIAELEPNDLIWLVMMFDLVVERFWTQQYQAPALSYTAEMLKEDSALLSVAQSANLPVPAYKPVGLKPLTSDDLRQSQLSEAEIGKVGVSQNLWLEDRYGHLVSDESLNVVADPHAMLTLELDTGRVSSLVPASVSEMQHKNVAKSPSAKLSLNQMNSAAFGSRERLDADRKFIARCNFADQVKVHAINEYETRKDEVASWYRRSVLENADALLQWAGNESFWVDDGPASTFTHFNEYQGGVSSYESDVGKEPQRHICHQLMRRVEISKERDLTFYTRAIATLGTPGGAGAMCCAITGAKASFLTMFYPTNSQEIALLAGCSVENLPDVLQNWSLLDPYTGNSILSRIDPMLWRLQDPWQKIDFRVRIALSKRGLSAVQKTASIPLLPNLTLVRPTGKKAITTADTSEAG